MIRLAPLFLLLMLTGCDGWPRVPAAASDAVTLNPPTPSPVTVDASDPVAVAAAQVARAQAALAVAKADLAAAKAQAEEAEQTHLRALLAWVSGIALLGAIACAAAAFLVPVGKRWCAVGSLACVGVLALAWGMRSLLPWLPAIGLATLAGIVVVGIVAIRRVQIAAILASLHGDEVEQIDPADAVGMLEAKVRSATDQAKAGVWSLLESLRVKAERAAMKGKP